MNTQSSVFLKSVFWFVILCFTPRVSICSSAIDISLLTKREEAPRLLRSQSVCSRGSSRSASPCDSLLPTNDPAKVLVRRSCSAPKVTREDMETIERSLFNLMGLAQKYPNLREDFGEAFVAIGRNLKEAGAQCNFLKSPSTIKHRKTHSTNISKSGIEQQTSNSTDISSVYSDSESIDSSLSSVSPIIPSKRGSIVFDEGSDSDSVSILSSRSPFSFSENGRLSVGESLLNTPMQLTKKVEEIPEINLNSNNTLDSDVSSDAVVLNCSGKDGKVPCSPPKTFSAQIAEDIVGGVDITTAKIARKVARSLVEQQIKQRSAIIGTVPSSRLCHSMEEGSNGADVYGQYNPEDMQTEEMEKINDAVARFCDASQSSFQAAKGVYKSHWEDCFFITLGCDIGKIELDELAKVLLQDSYIWIENSSFELRFPEKETKTEIKATEYKWLDTDIAESDYTLFSTIVGKNTVSNYLSIDFPVVCCS